MLEVPAVGKIVRVVRGAVGAHVGVCAVFVLGVVRSISGRGSSVLLLVPPFWRGGAAVGVAAVTAARRWFRSVVGSGVWVKCVVPVRRVLGSVADGVPVA